MTSLLNRLFGRANRGSGATAKNRLHFVLQHDRINLPPERAEEMKKEILTVIVKYLAVDKDRVEIALEQRDRLHSKLVAELPIVNDTHAPEKYQTQAAAAVATPVKSNGAGKVTKPETKKATEDKTVAADSKKPVVDTTEDDAPADEGKR